MRGLLLIALTAALAPASHRRLETGRGTRFEVRDDLRHLAVDG
jgi:hypothetical protein